MSKKRRRKRDYRGPNALPPKLHPTPKRPKLFRWAGPRKPALRPLPALEIPDVWKPGERIGTDAELRKVLASAGRSGSISETDEQLLLVRRLNEFFGVNWLLECVIFARTTTDPRIRHRSDGTERSPLARFVRACFWTAMLARIDGHLTNIALTWLFARDKPNQPRPRRPPHLRPLGTMHYEQMRRQAKEQKRRAKEHAAGIERRAQTRVVRAAKRAAIRLAKKRHAADRNRARRAAKAARKSAALAKVRGVAPAAVVLLPRQVVPPPAAPAPPRRRIVALPSREPPPAPVASPSARMGRRDRFAGVEIEVLPTRPKK